MSGKLCWCMWCKCVVFVYTTVWVEMIKQFKQNSVSVLNVVMVINIKMWWCGVCLVCASVDKWCQCVWVCVGLSGSVCVCYCKIALWNCGMVCWKYVKLMNAMSIKTKRLKMWFVETPMCLWLTGIMACVSCLGVRCGVVWCLLKPWCSVSWLCVILATCVQFNVWLWQQSWNCVWMRDELCCVWCDLWLQS